MATRIGWNLSAGVAERNRAADRGSSHLGYTANKDFRYLTKTYLPRKLKEEDWLD